MVTSQPLLFVAPITQIYFEETEDVFVIAFSISPFTNIKKVRLDKFDFTKVVTVMTNFYMQFRLGTTPRHVF